MDRISSLPKTILHSVYLYLPMQSLLCHVRGLNQLFYRSTECKEFWKILSNRCNWEYRGKKWFMDKLHAVWTHRRVPKKIPLQGHTSGVLVLHKAKSLQVPSWKLGQMVSIDEGILVSGASAPDSTFRVWDLNSGTCLRQFELAEHENSNSKNWTVAQICSKTIVFARNPNGASGTIPTLGWLDISSGSLKTVPAHTNLTLSGSYDRTSALWVDGKLQLSLDHKSTVWSVDLYAGDYMEELLLCVGDDDGNLNIWNVFRRARKRYNDWESPDPNNESEHELLLDWRSSLKFSKQAHSSTIISIQLDNVFPPTSVFSASYDTTIVQTNVLNGESMKSFSYHTGPVFSLALSSFILYATSRDGTMTVWDRHNGELLQQLKVSNVDVKAVELLSDESVATGGYDGLVHIWKFGNSKPELVRQVPQDCIIC